MSNQKLAEELHKTVIRKFEKQKVHPSLKDSIRGADLTDMQLISKFNEGIGYLLYVFDIFSKYTWVVPSKDKKGITNTNAFQIILHESEHKANKIWIDKGSEFHNKSMISLLQDSDLEMYSTHNEGKSVVSERFIRTLKNKIYKYMASV